MFGLRWDIGPKHRDVWDELVALYGAVSYDVVKIDAAQLLVYVADGMPEWGISLLMLRLRMLPNLYGNELLVPVIASQQQRDRITALRTE